MFPIPPFLTGRLVQVIVVLGLLFGIVYTTKSYIDGVYDKGYSAGVAAENKVWQDREEERIATQNANIDALEKLAKEKADAYYNAMAAAEKKIELLNQKVKTLDELNKVLYTKTGEKKVCPAGTEVYLGVQFSDLWNEYNTVLKPGVVQ